MVWEYTLENRSVDAIWFPSVPSVGEEHNGKAAARRHPLKGVEVVLCEAKAAALTPELVGQALVYRQFVLRAGAIVRDTVVFAPKADDAMRRAAAELGLTLVVTPSL
jgi:hypothetical protein